tara:strand:+ start:7541 stop:8023 length:483 start_codon:yes stop_codon:yes gene_type:complete
MLEYYPLEEDAEMGFVIVDKDFEDWLIATMGLNFEDISFAVLGEDEEGEMELIIDEDDFYNLQDVHHEYETYGWAILDDPEYEDWEQMFALTLYEADMARKMYLRGYNPERFNRTQSSPRSRYGQTRRNIRKDMWGSVSLTGVLATVGIVGFIAYLAQRN